MPATDPEGQLGFHLWRGDELLGVLSRCEVDMPWYRCAFEPTAAFEVYRPLFEEESRLLKAAGESGDRRAWEAASDRVDQLGLRLERTDGRAGWGKVLLYVRQDRASFRPYTRTRWERQPG